MDQKAKQVGSCSSSSFTVDLFGPKDSSKSSSSSTDLFGSIFGPPTPMVPGRDTTRPDFGHAYGNPKHENTTDYNTQKGNPMKNNKKSEYENGRSVAEPCYYNSSIYYGGQEVYSPTSSRNISPPHNFKKDGGGNVDVNESNSSCASRGNWWKESNGAVQVVMAKQRLLL
ncbi:hypothetical protein DH2020_022239 [Rehmannia glutinosa]|uniref:Uncharacterized protein n=1 Tax=Rehmannia glutinosa TaxID=99300 RepID=A0ABR0WEB0_REHGL